MSHPPEGSVAFAVVIQVMHVMAQAGGFTFRVDGMTVTVVRDGSPEVMTLLLAWSALFGACGAQVVNASDSVASKIASPITK